MTAHWRITGRPIINTFKLVVLSHILPLPNDDSAGNIPIVFDK